MFSFFKIRQRKEIKELKLWTKSRKFLNERVRRSFDCTPYSVTAFWEFGVGTKNSVIMYEEFSWRNIKEQLKHYEANILPMDLAEKNMDYRSVQSGIA